MVYRPEIDGLRFIAVASVILFHSGVSVFRGGYLGVDIFFVISGYLIFTIIEADLRQNKFRLINFFERRARRILPLLFFVCLGVSVPSFFVMLPDALENFGQSLVATTLFSNNILLYFTAGYWDLASEFKPLLHTWSLSVEEQFYLIFPLLLMTLSYFGTRAIFLCLLIIFFVSLYLFFKLGQTNVNAQFYLLHSRAWELLAGAIGAMLHSRSTPLVRESLSLLGLAGVVGSMALAANYEEMKIVVNVLVVISTVLLLLFLDRGTVVGAVISQPLFVYLGLLSYGAYLWHQPLLSYFRIWGDYDVVEVSALAVFLISIGSVSYTHLTLPTILLV